MYSIGRAALLGRPDGVNVPALKFHRRTGRKVSSLLLRGSNLRWSSCVSSVRRARRLFGKLIADNREFPRRLDAKLYSPPTNAEDFDEYAAFYPEAFVNFPIED